PSTLLDDWGVENTVDYEPWTGVDEGLENLGIGELLGVYATGHVFEVPPGETITVSAVLSYVDGPQVGDIQVWAWAYDVDGQYISGSARKVISGSYGGFYSGMYVVPEAGGDVALGFLTGVDVDADTMVRFYHLGVRREGRVL